MFGKSIKNIEGKDAEIPFQFSFVRLGYETFLQCLWAVQRYPKGKRGICIWISCLFTRPPVVYDTNVLLAHQSYVCVQNFELSYFCFGGGSALFNHVVDVQLCSCVYRMWCCRMVWAWISAADKREVKFSCNHDTEIVSFISCLLLDVAIGRMF